MQQGCYIFGQLYILAIEPLLSNFWVRICSAFLPGLNLMVHLVVSTYFDDVIVLWTYEDDD